MSEKILVTGANGMLGQDLCPVLEDSGFEVIETDIDNLDITDPEQIKKVIDAEKPDYIFHCAAFTNVDGAEDDPDKAFLLNGTGSENLAEIAGQNDITFIYISTDYVFDGKSDKPYKPSDTPNPINIYGKSKYEGELAVQKYCKKYYILRTSWLYGHHGKNFVETMLSLKDNPQLKVVDDQTGCPTWTVDLAEAAAEIISDKNYGIYHVCGSGYTSWYGFAKEIFKLYGKDVNLLPCKTSEFPRKAQRPSYSVMDNSGICRDWKSALKDYMMLRQEEI